VRVQEITAKFVAPFYLHLLHRNLASSPAAERAEVLAQMRLVAPDPTLDGSRALWSVEEWRCDAMAWWWATVWGWPETVDAVEPRLIPSRLVFGERRLAVGRTA
jgi:hypothetical protein